MTKIIYRKIPYIYSAKQKTKHYASPVFHLVKF